MEADWEIEIGGGSPVIEALWPGFVDLRLSPERIGEIAEAASFPALARLLEALNGAGSPLWTAKCDLWEPEDAQPSRTDTYGLKSTGQNTIEPDRGTSAAAAPALSAPSALACYIDLLPLDGKVFSDWKQAESFCREWIARLSQLQPLTAHPVQSLLPDCRLDLSLDLRLDLIVRQAIAGHAEGFGVTAYLSAVSQAGAGEGDRPTVSQALSSAMGDLAAAIPPATPPATAAAKLQ